MKQEGKGDDGIKYFIIIMYGYIYIHIIIFISLH